jgi:hypothetical protein
MPRHPDEIAAEVVAFGVTMAEAKKLVALAKDAFGFGRVPNVKAIQAEIEKDRQWLLKRGNRHAREFGLPVLANLYSGAAGILDPKGITGPDSRFRWFERNCAHLAYGVIAHSRDKRMGPRLRRLASLLYRLRLIDS